MNPPPRLLPNLRLPDYSYVPGFWPHPHSTPAGASTRSIPTQVFGDSHWQENIAYLHGVDLWNHGYYWEAHEAWEALWHAAGRKGPAADFFKGLIQLAVAGVKVREGRTESVQRHAKRAAELFQNNLKVNNTTSYCGLSIPELIEQANVISNSPPASSPSDRAPVRIVFQFVLRPTCDAA